jgi:hypothetical protein
MASVRGLKKEIDLKLSFVLNDCFLVAEANKNVDKETIMAVAADVIGKHHELRQKVNHAGGKDNSKLVKEHYNSIVSELKLTVDGSLERLSKEIKKE